MGDWKTDKQEAEEKAQRAAEERARAADKALSDMNKLAEIPLPDDAAAEKARKRSLAKQQARGGRASTILSTSDKLG